MLASIGGINPKVPSFSMHLVAAAINVSSVTPRLCIKYGRKRAPISFANVIVGGTYIPIDLQKLSRVRKNERQTLPIDSATPLGIQFLQRCYATPTVKARRHVESRNAPVVHTATPLGTSPPLARRAVFAHV